MEVTGSTTGVNSGSNLPAGGGQVTEQPPKKFNSVFDTDTNAKVEIKEQKATIADQLKNVWKSHIARFFKDDISYDEANEQSAKSVDTQVSLRQANALAYIQYAKENNIDIFLDNTGTGVEDVDGEMQEYTASDGSVYKTRANPGAKSSVTNSDGTHTTTYNNGSSTVWSANSLRLSDIDTDSYGDKYKIDYNYNEDGSYTYTTKFDAGMTWHNVSADKNDNMVNNTGFYETARGNVKAYAQEGETFEQTLANLCITDPVDIAAIRKANPKAAKAGKFRTDVPDVYIPKAVYEHMQTQNGYSADKLARKP